MRAVRTGALLGVTIVLLVSCNADDPVDAAADAICAGIDAEASDEAAFEEYELSLTRERRNGMDEGELRAALDERCGRAITVISAATEPAPTPEEPDAEPMEPPSADPVDLQNVVWGDQDWTSTCVESGESTSMSLTQGNEPGALWSNVGSGGEFLTTGMNYGVDTTSVVYGDITGDDLEEAVFASECSFGSGYSSNVEVWSHDEDGHALQLPTVIEYTKWDGVIEGFEIVEGKLRINTSQPAPGEDTPHLNGYLVEVVTDWSFDGSEWLSDEISRSDPPQAEPAGPATCSNFGASPEDATICFIDALSQGDREAANKAATDMIVEFFFEGPAIGPPSPGATFQGCGEPRLGMREAGGVACFWEDPGSGEFVQFDVVQQDGAYRVAGAGYGSGYG